MLSRVCKDDSYWIGNLEIGDTMCGVITTQTIQVYHGIWLEPSFHHPRQSPTVFSSKVMTSPLLSPVCVPDVYLTEERLRVLFSGMYYRHPTKQCSALPVLSVEH